MAIRYEKDEQNIVMLTLDRPGRSANVINEAFGAALAEALARLQAEPDLAGVILTSAKKTFMAGADLEDLELFSDAAKVFAGSEALKAGFRQLETLGKPVVAALNGTAVGGGFELALACHHRIALDDPTIKFGFPEVTLGLLPGGGGIVRLTRMIGLQNSFPFLMEGKQVKPQEAKAAGLIDDLASDRDELMDKAHAWIAAHPKAQQPWDQPGYKMPGGNAQTPKVVQMLAIAPAMLRKQTHGNYPAPEAIMRTAVLGSTLTFDAASRLESRAFAEVATSKVARNMTTAFWFQLNEINKGASRPDLPPTETHKVGVLGAGMMGHGIAYVTAWAGMDVVLKDVTAERAEEGKAKIAALAQKRVGRGQMTAVEKQALLDRIHPTGDAADLQGCDLVIEAVFEDRELKARVTAEVEAQLADTAVFASNTSTLPITGLAQKSLRPSHFIGLHFFSPVERMKLVEIIVGQETNDDTLAKAFDYVLKIRKTPIVVNDSRGFYTSRVFGTYVNEGMALLAEGQHPHAIEIAGLQAGMPVGPLAVSDEVSLSLMVHIRQQTAKDLAAEGKETPQHPAFPVVDAMVAENRLGKAHGAGFYDYPADGKKLLWPGLRDLFPPNGQLPQEEMIERLLFVQALETVRCFEEGVLRSVADANIGSIFGWGFAPFKGGTLQYINDYGLPAFVVRSRELAAHYGSRFTPPQLLVEMANRDERF
ncbi:MAG TPA: 3-hydroxyacyl-CoA dehydrogenase NAD-binding domain-containing protein [Chloroflexota bacterium]|nr:3-hydroxyacyl-CoA dehydrogenase NAD-binding domain-containing protein [Chloroflexota bacterium]